MLLRFFRRRKKIAHNIEPIKDIEHTIQDTLRESYEKAIRNYNIAIERYNTAEDCNEFILYNDIISAKQKLNDVIRLMEIQNVSLRN